MITENPIKRLAYASIFAISFYSSLEKGGNKPFNPLLGETFEFVTDRYQFLAE